MELVCQLLSFAIALDFTTLTETVKVSRDGKDDGDANARPQHQETGPPRRPKKDTGTARETAARKTERKTVERGARKAVHEIRARVGP